MSLHATHADSLDLIPRHEIEQHFQRDSTFQPGQRRIETTVNSVPKRRTQWRNSLSIAADVVLTACPGEGLGRNGGPVDTKTL